MHVTLYLRIYQIISKIIVHIWRNSLSFCLSSFHRKKTYLYVVTWIIFECFFAYIFDSGKKFCFVSFYLIISRSIRRRYLIWLIELYQKRTLCVKMEKGTPMNIKHLCNIATAFSSYILYFKVWKIYTE